MDLVAADLLELAQLEVEELLAATPFAGAPVLPVSSTTGQGVPELKAALLDLAAQPRHAGRSGPAGAPAGRPRLPSQGARRGGDRHARRAAPSGRGTRWRSCPGGERVRVRSVQVHGQPREQAEAGERTSLQLTGVALEELARGMQLGTPEAFEATTSLLARFTLLPDAPAPIRGFVPVRLHLYASEVLGPHAPARPPRGWRRGRPDRSRSASRRRSRPCAGTATSSAAPRRPRRSAAARSSIRAGGATAARILAAGADGAPGGPPRRPRPSGCRRPESAASRRPSWRAGWACRRRRWPSGWRRSRRDQKLIEVPEEHGRARRWIAPAAVQRVTERARRVLKEHFQKDRLAESMPKAEAVRRILRGRAAELADVYLGWLAAQKVLAVQGDQVTLPGRSAQLTGEESKLSTAVLERFEKAGLAPPSPGEVAQELGAKPQILDGVIRHLVARGQLVKLPSGLILAASALDRPAAATSSPPPGSASRSPTSRTASGSPASGPSRCSSISTRPAPRAAWATTG